MTTRIAMILAALIVLLVVLDQTMRNGDDMLFLAKKLFALIDYLAFWR